MSDKINLYVAKWFIFIYLASAINSYFYGNIPALLFCVSTICVSALLHSYLKELIEVKDYKNEVCSEYVDLLYKYRILHEEHEKLKNLHNNEINNKK